jgi:GntR family histidine utilization transcriptional repressor
MEFVNPDPQSHDLLPRYSQIKRMISSRIQSGSWRPGDRIASEAELVRELGVSRMTINRALRELTLEGQLIRVQGVGTFVAESKAQSALFEVRNIADEIRARGSRHEARVVILRREAVDEPHARLFDMKPGDEIYHSLLLHLENDIPIQIEDRLVDPRLARDYLAQDFTAITPYVYLTEVAPISEAEHVIEAVLPSAEERRLLKIPAKEPCIRLHRRTWSDGRLVSIVDLTYPGSRYRLSGRFKG